MYIYIYMYVYTYTYFVCRSTKMSLMKFRRLTIIDLIDVNKPCYEVAPDQ